MLNTVQENAAEEIAVNPDQAAHAINNVDKLTGTTSVREAIMDPNLVTGSLNHSFLKDKNWQDYAADPLRTFKEENKHLFGIENMARDPVWYSTIDRYGKEFADRSMALHGFAKPAQNWGSRVIEAYDNARYGLRVAAARKDLSDARLDGDPVKIAEAEAKYESEQKKLEFNGTPFEDYGNTLMQLSASMARNPEIFLAMAAGAAVTAGTSTVLAPVAAGAISVGAGAAGVSAAAASSTLGTVLGGTVASLGSAAIVGADTYRLESGSALQELDIEHPELSEERKHSIARTVGAVNAAIEAVPTALSGGIIGRGVSSVNKAVTRAVMKSRISEETVRNPLFIKELKKGIKDATFGKIAFDVGVDSNIEGATEMLQDIMQKAAMKVADNPDTSFLQNAGNTIAGLIADPWPKENAELWNTYISVALTSPIFGLPMTGVRVASVAKHRGTGTLNDKIHGVQSNKSIAKSMFDYRQNSESAKVNPAAASEHLRQMIKSEGINSEVYLDKAGVAELRKDPEVAKKLEELGVPQAVEESFENGGNIAVDLVKYDEIVNTDKELYQKIKDIVSFQPNTLSVSEMTRFLEGVNSKGVNEIVTARGDANSVYNKALEMFKTAGYGDYEAKFNASIMQLSLNRIGGFRKSGKETAEQVMQRLSLNIAGREGGQDVSLEAQAGMQGGLTQEAGDNILHQFVGSRNVETANTIADTLGKRAELDRARAMADEAIAKGESPDYEAIWAETGWYQNEDTSWSYEIADNEATLDKSKFFTEKGVTRTGVHTTLGAVMKHDRLFDLFPELKDIPLHIGKSNISGVQNKTSIALYHGGQRPEIIMNASAIARAKQSEGSIEGALAQAKSSILHELQHHLQDKMDMMYFPQYRGDKEISFGGRTIEQSKELLNLSGLLGKVEEIAKKYGVDTGKTMRDTFAHRDELLTAAQTEEEKQAVKDFVDKYIETGDYNINYDEGYYRKSFEMQARNTQARVNFTEEQRRTISPSATKDIAGTVEVGRSVSKQELEKNKRRVGLIKFSGQPVETAQAPVTQDVTATPTKKKGGKKVAGKYTSNAQTGVMGITLTKDANATTFAHEAFHMFVDNLIRAVNDKDVTTYWEDKAIKMIKAVDGQVNEDETITLTEAQEEKLANMFMSYIVDGKIENKTLTPVFAFMSKLFRQLYRDLGLHKYELSKDIREVFDSVFRSQDEIEYHQRLVGIFEMEKPANAEQDLYDFYVAEMLNSRAKGAADLRKKLFAIEGFKKSKTYQKAFDQRRLEALKVLGDTVTYRIVNDLAKKYDNNPDKILLDLTQTDPEIRMTVEDVKSILKNTVPMEEAARQQAQQEMDELIEKRYNLTQEELGFNEERNMSKIRALVAESLMRSGKTMADFEAEMQRVSDAVKRHISKTSLKRLLDRKYWNDQEAKIVDWYALALSKGDEAAMAECRYNQAVVNLIRMRSDVIANKVKRFRAFAESIKFGQKKIKHTFDGVSTMEHKYTAEAYDLLQSIVDNFGFPIMYERRADIPVGTKLNNWIALQERSTYTSVGVLREWMGFINNGYGGTIDAMTGGMFENLFNVVDAIEGVASTERSIILDNQKHSVSESIKETAKSFKERNLKPMDESTSVWAKTFGVLGRFTNPEPLLAAIFPRSVMNRIWLPLINSCVKGEAKGRELVEAYRAAKGKLGGITSNTKTYATGDTMRFCDVCDLFLAMGNEHAYSNFVIKFFGTDDATTRQRAEAIVSEAVRDNHNLVDFVNKVWALYKEVGDIATETYKNRENKPFIAKPHREFTINGIKFEGGYVPEHKSNEGFRNPENNNFYQQGMIREHGFEKLVVADADGKVKSIVDSTEFELFESAKESLLGVDFNNAVRFMMDPRTQEVIGSGAYKYINDWMAIYRKPKYDEGGIYRGLATLTTVSALGIRASTALLQISGIIQSWAATGAVPTMRALVKVLSSREDMLHPLRAASTRSDYMKARMGDPESVHMGMSVTQLANTEEGKNLATRYGKLFVKKAMEYAMLPIQIVDGYVANVTWEAAHQKALDMGMTEQEATLQADSTVRQVQSDAMQISRAPAMQNDIARGITAFGTWIMAMQSFVRAKWGTNQKGDAITFAIMYIFVSTALESVLKEALDFGDDGNEEKDFVDKALERWYNQIIETAGATAMPYGGFGSLIARLGAAGVEKGLTDENEIFSTYTGGIPFVQTVSKIARTGQYSLEALTSGFESDPSTKAIVTGTSIFSNSVSKVIKNLLEED